MVEMRVFRFSTLFPFLISYIISCRVTHPPSLGGAKHTEIEVHPHRIARKLWVFVWPGIIADFSKA